MSTRRITRPIPLHWEHRLVFTRDLFAPANSSLLDVIREHPSVSIAAPRIAVFIDEGAAAAHPEMIAQVESWAQRNEEFLQLAGPPRLVPGGETSKNDPAVLDTLLAEIVRAELCRHSFILVIGGGAVLDVVGFAAATAHRGIPLIRIPTTSLAQGDSGVGVKNGVNHFGRKNWLGTFSVPFAVINDSAFLESLPPTDRRAGLIEALKVALIRDADFFQWIAAHADALANFETGPYETAIERSALIHLDHIAGNGDPFEYGSSRPLDFGHWSAHKLEQLSDFALSHGEAVAIGMALDLTYGAEIGLMPSDEAAGLVDLIARLGFRVFSPLLESSGLIAGLEEFREHLGGELTIPMIVSPGIRQDLHEMDADAIGRAIGILRRRETVPSES